MTRATLSLKSYQATGHSHQHEFHQLVLPVKGTLDIEIGSSSGLVCSNNAAIICAAENHTFMANGDNEFIVADIPIQLAPTIASLPAFVAIDDSIKKYLLFLQSELNEQTTHDNKLIQRQMLLLLLQLLDDKHTRTAVLDKRILLAREYLESHFKDKDALRKACQSCHLSERHFRQLFSKYYDMTPSQYLLELRMQCAAQLLKNTNLSLQIIAERCGYKNSSAFVDRFHKHFSYTPMQVRRFNK